MPKPHAVAEVVFRYNKDISLTKYHIKRGV